MHSAVLAGAKALCHLKLVRGQVLPDGEVEERERQAVVWSGTASRLLAPGEGEKSVSS